MSGQPKNFLFGILIVERNILLREDRNGVFDSNNPEPQLASDNGTLQRQKRIGEPRAAFRQSLATARRIGEDRNRTDIGEIFRLGAASQYRWFKAHEHDPLPSPDLGPDPAWPDWARFRLVEQLQDWEDMSEGDERIYYATAAEMADLFEEAFQPVYDAQPEWRDRIDQMRDELRYWIRHDAICSPGSGRTVEIDGYRWDPEKLEF